MVRRLSHILRIRVEELTRNNSNLHATMLLPSYSLCFLHQQGTKALRTVYFSLIEFHDTTRRT